MWCMVEVQFHFFTYEYPIFTASFMEKTSFSPLSVRGSLVKYQLIICAGVYFCGFNSVLLVHFSVFMPAPYCFDVYGFILQLEIRKHVARCFILLSEDFFGIWRLLWFHLNFGRDFFPPSEKMLLEY